MIWRNDDLYKKKRGKGSRKRAASCAGARQERAPHRKLRRGKEAGAKEKDQLQPESNRLENMRKDIDRARKEFNRDIKTIAEKEKNQQRERDRTRELDARRLRVQRRDLEKT